MRFGSLLLLIGLSALAYTELNGRVERHQWIGAIAYYLVWLLGFAVAIVLFGLAWGAEAKIP